MDEFIINGGRKLSGKLKAHGAKNSALPLLTAAILPDSPSVIHNCPNLTDIDNCIEILKHLGCAVTRENDTVTVDPRGLCKNDIPLSMMECMRSSIVFLGALLSKTGSASLYEPGGCKIGKRPIDLHISALKNLGVSFECNDGMMEFRLDGGFKGTGIRLDFPSVGATENIMLASVLSCGVTVIENAAREPEIVDLANFLTKMGARVYGAGEKRIVIEGVSKLNGAEYNVMADRIEVATFMSVSAITKGKLTVSNAQHMHLIPVIDVFGKMGCEITVRKNEISLVSPERLKSPGVIHTMPYPGFPTDCQAIVMAMTSVADGDSLFYENIFENRFLHVPELIKMGADIRIKDTAAIVKGVSELYGSKIESNDLRGGAALVAAALKANGESVVSGIHHIDRGYEEFENSLLELGADIRRS